MVKFDAQASHWKEGDSVSVIYKFVGSEGVVNAKTGQGNCSLLSPLLGHLLISSFIFSSGV